MFDSGLSVWFSSSFIACGLKAFPKCLQGIWCLDGLTSRGKKHGLFPLTVLPPPHPCLSFPWPLFPQSSSRSQAISCHARRVPPSPVCMDPRPAPPSLGSAPHVVILFNLSPQNRPPAVRFFPLCSFPPLYVCCFFALSSFPFSTVLVRYSKIFVYFLTTLTSAVLGWTFGLPLPRF